MDETGGAGAAWALAFSLGTMAFLLLGIAVALIMDQRRTRVALAEAERDRAGLQARLDALLRTRAEAEAASEAKSRFLATVSHEIRTPLNGVLGMADLMLDTPLDPEQQNYARAIRTSGEALLTLIEEILDFSRIEAGKVEIVEDATELTPLVEGVVELLAPRAQGKGIEVAAFIAGDLPAMIRTDAARLRQIVMNLAGNAVKFTESGGVGIRISRHGEGDDTLLRIAVADTGPGIPAHRLDAIFGEFEQADHAIARKHSGTGLGLAISRRLARLMGGDIRVESTPGEGSCFTLDLPLTAGIAESGGATGDVPQFGISGKRVLIVAAGPFEGAFIAEVLAGEAQAVARAQDEATAIASISGNAPDLVIVDAALGQESARRIVAASLEAGCRRHLVLLSPFERRSFGPPGAAGFDRYLVKPIRRRSLAAQLGDWSDARLTAEPAMPVELLAPALEGKRVLIAEDNDINALLAGRLVEHLGGRSIRASNGVEALDLLEASRQPGGQPFDLAFFDMRMPELDGLSAIRAWRLREKAAGFAALPAIALTANAFAEDRAACLAAGFDAFLAKPLDRETFLETLRRLSAGTRKVA